MQNVIKLRLFKRIGIKPVERIFITLVKMIYSQCTTYGLLWPLDNVNRILVCQEPWVLDRYWLTYKGKGKTTKHVPQAWIGLWWKWAVWALEADADIGYCTPPFRAVWPQIQITSPLCASLSSSAEWGMIITSASWVSLKMKRVISVCAYIAGEAPGTGMSAFTQPGEALLLQLWKLQVGPCVSNAGCKSCVLCYAVN